MDCEIPIGARFSILHRSFRRRIDELIGEQGLTGVQGFVLCELHRMEMAGLEEINQRDLERATHLSHPTLNEIIKRLEAKGFVSCRVSTRDRRSKCIVSAPMAGEVFRCMDSLDRTVFDELCRGLSEEQTAEFLNTTDIMLVLSKRMLRKPYATTSASGSGAPVRTSENVPMRKPMPMMARSLSSHSQSVALAARLSG